MIRFIIRRLLKGVFTIWVIWTLVFILIRLSGDPIEWMLPPDVTSETIKQNLRETLGLDLPLWEQYIRSFTNIFTGNMGTSYFYKREVAGLFAERFAATYQIAVPGLLFAALLGIPAGIVAAMKHDTAIDRVTMSAALIFHTIPGFAFAIILVLIFSLGLHLLPSGNTGTWKNLVMPIICLTVGPMATIARLTRSSMLDVLHKEFLDGARMKGVKERVVIVKHALRSSLIPVATTMGLQLGTIIGGAVVVETVYGWPGVGTLLVTAAKRRDFPIVQFGILLLAVVVVVANIIVDVSYGWLDPRIRENFK